LYQVTDQCILFCDDVLCLWMFQIGNYGVRMLVNWAGVQVFKQAHFLVCCFSEYERIFCSDLFWNLLQNIEHLMNELGPVRACVAWFQRVSMLLLCPVYVYSFYNTFCFVNLLGENNLQLYCLAAILRMYTCLKFVCLFVCFVLFCILNKCKFKTNFLLLVLFDWQFWGTRGWCSHNIFVGHFVLYDVGQY
jgi:hypothetical protein